MATGERASTLGARVAQAHAHLLADRRIQFELTAFTAPKPPAWLTSLLKMLIGNWSTIRVGFWILLAAVVLILAIFVIRWAVKYYRIPKAERRPGLSLASGPQSLRPTEPRARALLEEADRLAAEQRFEEAAHVLLFRTIDDLRTRRPRSVRPALTSRDIAGLSEIPPAARSAFAVIAERVEASFFGARGLTAADFAACRQAYSAFASPGSWAAGATA